eukprot:COSAG02_NODE_2147_length_9663_cov_8.071936_6_plen_57_part_00
MEMEMELQRELLPTNTRVCNTDGKAHFEWGGKVNATGAGLRARAPRMRSAGGGFVV